jgi:hypothetical protein
MKSNTPLLLAAVLTTLASSISSSHGALVAYWNFNTLSIPTATTPGNGAVPTSIAANEGTGTINLSGWGGNVDDFGGSNLNSLNSDVSGVSLSLIAGGPSAGPFPGNNTYIDISFSTVGLPAPTVTFAAQGTSTGFDSGTWSWSVDGTNFTPLAGVNTGTRATYALATADFSGVTQLENQANVTLRYTLSGATSNSGNNRIDNLQVNAIPEPSAALLGAVGLLALIRRRR